MYSTFQKLYFHALVATWRSAGICPFLGWICSKVALRFTIFWCGLGGLCMCFGSLLFFYSFLDRAPCSWCLTSVCVGAIRLMKLLVTLNSCCYLTHTLFFFFFLASMSGVLPWPPVSFFGLFTFCISWGLPSCLGCPFTNFYILIAGLLFFCYILYIFSYIRAGWIWLLTISHSLLYALSCPFLCYPCPNHDRLQLNNYLGDIHPVTTQIDTHPTTLLPAGGCLTTRFQKCFNPVFSDFPTTRLSY